MPDYISPPLVTEPDDLSNEAFAQLEAQVEGWLPNPGNLETWVIEAIAQMAGELMDVASAVPVSNFRYFGASLMSLPPKEATSASAVTVWAVQDDLGYTIPQGTLVGIPATGDELLAFAVTEDIVIAPGATAPPANVILTAQDQGTDANGLTGTPQLIDALDFVTSVLLVDATSGGVDQETDTDYLTRLRGLLRLMAPRPILPEDFATMALQVPGVARATAIDGYNADTEETDVARCVTVVVADPEGLPVAPAIQDEVKALLESRREVNFLVFAIDPTYTTVDVSATVKPYPDFDADDVMARTTVAITNYLRPQNFGALPYGETPAWLADDHVRYLEVAEVINRVEGVWYIVTLQVDGAADDIVLDGPGALPEPGSVSVSVDP